MNPFNQFNSSVELSTYADVWRWFNRNIVKNCTDLKENQKIYADNFNYFGMQFYKQKLKVQARACFLIAWWLGNSIAYGNYLAML